MKWKNHVNIYNVDNILNHEKIGLFDSILSVGDIFILDEVMFDNESFQQNLKNYIKYLDTAENDKNIIEIRIKS